MQSSGPAPIGDLPGIQARRRPDRIALTFEGQSITRAEFDTAVNRMARALEQLGIGEGDVVSLILSTSPKSNVFAFAVWKLGASPSPLSPKLARNELVEILALSKPKALIGGDRELAGPAIWIPQDFEPASSESAEPFPAKISKPWKIIASGGSTGRPKLIVDHGAGLADPLVPMPLLQIKLDDVVLHPAPIYHNAPFTQVHWALGWGGHVIQMAKFRPEEWLALVDRHRVRWAYLVPTMMHRIWALPEEVRNRHDLSSLEVVIHMAAPCPEWLKEAWINWLGPDKIQEVYAGTEGFGATTITGREWLDHRGSVGKPMRPLRICSSDGKELPVGEVGEIRFQVPPGMGGNYSYIGAKFDADAEWQSFGDMGRVDSDGYLYLADRRTDMIVAGGVNLYPAEIEAAIEAHPAVGGCAVVGLPDPDLGSLPHAIIQVSDLASAPTPGEIRDFLKDRLAGYKTPRSLEFVVDPIRDNSGKVRRSQLRESRLQAIAAGRKFTPLA